MCIQKYLLREVNPLNGSEYLKGLVFAVASKGYLGKPKKNSSIVKNTFLYFVGKPKETVYNRILVV